MNYRKRKTINLCKNQTQNMATWDSPNFGSKWVTEINHQHDFIIETQLCTLCIAMLKFCSNWRSRLDIVRADPSIPTKTKRKSGSAWFTQFRSRIDRPTQICTCYSTILRIWFFDPTSAIMNANKSTSAKPKRKNGNVWFTKCRSQIDHQRQPPTWLHYRK